MFQELETAVKGRFLIKGEMFRLLFDVFETW